MMTYEKMLKLSSLLEEEKLDSGDFKILVEVNDLNELNKINEEFFYRTFKDEEYIPLKKETDIISTISNTTFLFKIKDEE